MFTPDMTYAQYTAKVADAMGSPDYFQQAKDYFTSDQHKRQLAQALGVSPDSDLVNYGLRLLGSGATDQPGRRNRRGPDHIFWHR